MEPNFKNRQFEVYNLRKSAQKSTLLKLESSVCFFVCTFIRIPVKESVLDAVNYSPSCNAIIGRSSDIWMPERESLWEIVIQSNLLLPLATKESVRKSRGKHKRHQWYLLEMKDAIQVALFRMMPWQVSRHSCLQITDKLLFGISD